MMEVAVTVEAIGRAKLQSNHYHQQTNTKSFFTGRMPFLLPNQKCQSSQGKISHPMELLIPNSPEGLPALSLATNSSWLLWVGLPCLSSALWCQYPRINKQYLSKLTQFHIATLQPCIGWQHTP